MKILFVGDAVVSSGFARATHAACDALHEAGHDVAVLGINYFGDPHSYPYPIYPCMAPFDGGRDGFGETRLPVLAHRLQPDVIVILTDPWCIPNYIASFKARWPDELPMPVMVGWLAVDAINQRGKTLNDLDHIAVWTEFAELELARTGCTVDMSIVPLGVDLSVFTPRDRAESRKRMLPQGFPDNGFVIGVVGRNQLRKRLDLTLSYFADWLSKYDSPDSPGYLYLHVGPTGDTGIDIRSLATYYRIGHRVILAEPQIGTGIPTSALPHLYSAMDVYITTTQGEGWGLPCLEAMACGVPCIVPDWSGLGDWTRDAAVKIPCHETAPTGPMNALAYTLGGIPDRRETIHALRDMHRSPTHRSTIAARGFRLAQSFSWATTGALFRGMIDAAVQSAVERRTQEAEPVAAPPTAGLRLV